MAVTSVQILHATDVERRAKFLRKIITYRIKVNSQTDGPDTIYASASIPVVDSSGYVAPFKYGTDSDNNNLVCREVRNLRKVVKWSGTVAVWQLDAEFVYDRDQTLADKGVTVKPLTRVESQIVSVAEFKSFQKIKTAATLALGDQYEEDTTINEADPPDLNTTPVLRKNKLGPITNSAGTPIVPAIEQPIGKAGLIVSWSKITPVDYAPFIGTVNNANVTITETHGVFSQTYAAGKLRLISAEQTPRDYFNARVVDVSLEFDFPEYEGDHFELDRGLAEFIQAGDSDGKGGTYSNTDLPLNGMKPLVGADGQPISQPIPFDGKGKAIENFEPPKARWLRYKTKPATSFASLGIGVYT
jgi:hypothetical protein